MQLGTIETMRGFRELRDSVQWMCVHANVLVRVCACVCACECVCVRVIVSGTATPFSKEGNDWVGKLRKSLVKVKVHTHTHSLTHSHRHSLTLTHTLSLSLSLT